jgi:lipopolysaccharide/colanic/teichoic acid biosynthesis glycosyltransferase
LTTTQIPATDHAVGPAPPPPRMPPRSALAVKRAIDVAGSVTGLVLFSPVFAAVAIAIKRESPGPVFFRQLRMGSGDRTFRVFKFRTMVADADERKADYAHLNKHAQNGSNGTMFKIRDDPRVTRVGRVLRRHFLDELPQLINVLRGEMSLVGPRPLILDEDTHVRDWARRRLDFRPGMTGLWQVLGHNEIPFERMVALDYAYVSRWSLRNDLRLLLRTLPVVVHGDPGRY